MALIEPPAIGRHLPEVLTIDEIEAMISAIDLDEPQGLRNRAIIETLYGSGLRVSELCTLERRRGVPRRGFPYRHRQGQQGANGTHERNSHRANSTLPETAGQHRRTYQAGRRRLSIPQPPRGTPHQGDDILYSKRPCREGGHTQNNLAAHPATFICHTPARGRRQPSSHTADARPRKHCHHRDLPASRQLAPT